MLIKLKSVAGRYFFVPFKKRPILGLDLGQDELRYLQLQKQESGYRVVKIGAQALPGGGAERLPVLKAWVKAQGLQGYGLALAVPGNALIKKKIELPGHFTEAEVLHELKFRISQYFPGESDQDLYYDFSLRETQESRLEVSWAATRKEPIQAQLRLWTALGLRVQIIDADFFALARAAKPSLLANQTGKKALAAVVAVDGAGVSLVVFHEQDLIFHHQWHFDPAQVLVQILSVWQLFRVNHSKAEINQIGLAGEYSGLAELAILLAEKLSLPVRLLEGVPGWGPRFLLCYGLALRGAG